MQTASLFDMTEEWKMLLEDLDMWAEENDGDVSEYPFERLDKLEGEIKDKALRIACLYKDLKAREEALAEEKKAMGAREKSIANHKDRLKKYLESCLPPNAKWESAKAALSWKKNPAAVEVLIPVEQLPAKYQVITRAPAKAELKADMKAFIVPELDGLGQPLFDTEGKPVTREEMQVRWPMPSLGCPIDKNGNLVDDGYCEIEDRVIARMVQGRSLAIK